MTIVDHDFDGYDGRCAIMVGAMAVDRCNQPPEAHATQSSVTPVNPSALRAATIRDSRLHMHTTLDRYITGVYGYLDHEQVSREEVERRQQACRSAFGGLMGMLARMPMRSPHEPWCDYLFGQSECSCQHQSVIERLSEPTRPILSDPATELATIRQIARQYFLQLRLQQVEIFGDRVDEAMAMLEESTTGSRTLADLRKRLEAAIAP